jgi:amino acid adenylation domain-containing protein
MASPSGSTDMQLMTELIGSHTITRPLAPAVVHADESLTYEELSVRSNRMANYLISLGIGEGDLVAICLPRCLNSVVASLAVMKTGAAYLPIDPAHDSERMAFVLQDAKPALLIALDQTPVNASYEGLRSISLEADADRVAQCSDQTPSTKATGDSLAYVIYTSGSTGRPKGVEITHAALLNLIEWHNGAFAITSDDRGTHLASPSFDASAWEIWPYLAAGASVRIVDSKIRNDATALRNWLVRNQVTACFAPTPLAEQMISLRWPPHTALRWLLTGADTLYSYPPPGLPFALVNNYGPTECTVVATSGVVLSNKDTNRKPSIGRAILSTKTYVLDENLNPVLPGEIGELYLGGKGVARGYRNRPDWTAERFLLDPFSVQPGARMYRTGDMVRSQPDGQLEFLGRTDSQVKLRGHRIELDEIVMAVNRCPEVRASAVAVRGEVRGESAKQIVAYVVVDVSASLREPDLRDFLRQQLPDYMQPSVFVRLDALPMNGNGKLDREALPDVNDENIWREQAAVLPQTPLEARLAAIVSSLLGMDRISTYDNFFALGGNSLLGTQMLARIGEELGIELPLRTIFDHPSVVDLAGEIERLQASVMNFRQPPSPAPDSQELQEGEN